jgi:hypothetical protein
MLARRAFALEAYNKARGGGEKHSCAFTEAVAAVKARFSGMPMSETEMKRIVKAWQPRGFPIAFRVSRDSGAQAREAIALYQALGLTGKPKTVLTFGLGPRPNYPRRNAKSR